MTQLTINIYSFIILLILSLVFFRKQRMHQIEDNTYAKILIIATLTIIIGIVLGVIVSQTNINEILIIILNKVYLIGLTIILTLFSFYTYSVFKKGRHLNTMRSLCIVVYITNTLIISFLPLNIEVNLSGVVPTGPSLYYTFLYLTVIYTLMLVFLIIDRKNFRNPKYLPIILMIICYIIFAIILATIPTLNYILNPLIVTTILVMYFTIENPDVKLMEELYKNKKIIENLNEENSRLLFKMTQNIKKEINDINENSKNIDVKSLTDSEINNLFKKINNDSMQVDYLINKSLNISGMDTQKIKIFDSRYNVNRLFDEIYRIQRLSMKDIEFNCTIAKNIPTYLYGDTVRLKQAITSVLEISRSFTNKGFINLEVNAIVKYNICRLIITIEDSGKGITVDRINKILSFDNDNLNKKDIDSSKSIDIFGVKKIINMLGGSLMIKSEESKGTIVTITLDQKIVETKETELTKKLEAYEKTLNKNKKILLIDDDINEIKQIESLLIKKNIDITSTIFDKDVVEKIRNNIKYDLIIIDDELAEESALNILNKLKEIKGFRTKVIVMLNDNKDKIKLQYLKDGFADYISKSKLQEELERILKRF